MVEQKGFQNDSQGLFELFAGLDYGKQSQSDVILIEKREQEDDSQGLLELFEGPEYECYPVPMLLSERKGVSRDIEPCLVRSRRHRNITRHRGRVPIFPVLPLHWEILA